MEITKREIIFSVVIVAVMLIIGFVIGGNIRQGLLEKYQEYDTAVKIDSQELFEYGMSTDIGNAFVYGDLKTLDPVGFPEISGQYSYIKKEEQEYRKHEKWVEEEYKDADGNTRTRERKEEYWTWDTMHTYEKYATTISFLDIQFEYHEFPFPSSSHVTTLDTGYHKRNVYSGTGTDFRGTIYTNLARNTINKTSFYNNLTISQAIENLESGFELVVFWIAWILLTALVVFSFYYLENRWLE